MHKEKVYMMFRHSLCLSSSIGKVVFSVPTLYMLERRPYKTGGVAGVWVSLYQCG